MREEEGKKERGSLRRKGVKGVREGGGGREGGVKGKG